MPDNRTEIVILKATVRVQGRAIAKLISLLTKHDVIDLSDEKDIIEALFSANEEKDTAIDSLENLIANNFANEIDPPILQQDVEEERKRRASRDFKIPDLAKQITEGRIESEPFWL